MIEGLVIAAWLVAAEPVEVLRDDFDHAGVGQLTGGAVLVEGPTGKAVKLEGLGSVLYEKAEFPREKGRMEMDLCPHAPVEPRTDGKHWMLLTDVGAAGAWRGATVIYWDRDTAVLSYGVFDGGWSWLSATGVSWPVGQWRHLTFTYGPEGRTLEVDGQVVARDGYSAGIAPRPMRLGYIDAYSVAAPVLVDNFVVTTEPVDALRVDRAVVCPTPDGLLDQVTLHWSAAEAGTATLDLRNQAGEVVAPIRGPQPVEAGFFDTPFHGAEVPSGDYEVRLTLERPGTAPKVLTARLGLDRELAWKPAPNRMGERFPLGVWYFWERDASYIGQHVDDEATARAYYERTTADLESLGLNTVIGNWTPRDHRPLLLEAAQRHHLRVIVHLDEVNSFLWNPDRLATENFLPIFREAVETARGHPATLGYYLVDEPAPTPENIANIRTVRQVIEALDPEHPGFSCLNVAWDVIYPQVGYQVLLVDLYPVYSARLEGDVLRGYVAALDRARQAAGDGLLWVIPQCFGFGGPNPHGIPVPHEVSLMVWEALAHGAKGIIYFIYQSTTNVQGEWLRGIVDENLQPMDHRYEEVRRLNAALSKVADVLLPLRWQPDALASSDPGVDVQSFRHPDGTSYLCVVNQDTHADVKAPLRFDPQYAGQIEGVEDVATGERLDSDGGVVVSLGPGEGKVLRLR